MDVSIDMMTLAHYNVEIVNICIIFSNNIPSLYRCIDKVMTRVIVSPVVLSLNFNLMQNHIK